MGCCMKNGGSQSQCCSVASTQIRARPACALQLMQLDVAENTSLSIVDFHVSCDCSWIVHDDCAKQDDCARGCRAANPWGLCGAGNTIQHVQSAGEHDQPQHHQHHHHQHHHHQHHHKSPASTASCNTAAACHGCSGEQCTLCQEEEQVKCCMKNGGSQSQCCSVASTQIRARCLNFQKIERKLRQTAFPC